MTAERTHAAGNRAVADRIAAHLHVLVELIGARPPGSPANRRATDYLADVLGPTGLAVRHQPFACKTWQPGPGRLELPERSIAVAPNPFSRPCDVRGRPLVVTSRQQLDTVAEPGLVLVLAGELSREPYFPKAFPFVQVPEQLSTITALEAARPAGVVAVTETGWPPVFEDADLAFPSITVAAPEAAALAAAEEVGLHLEGVVLDGAGVNVAAGAGSAQPRIVLSAHVDSKATTPGAFDNAGGVAVLLALAETGLPDAVELVFFNGEDHYAAPGEQAWLAETDLDTVRMAVNLDGAGVVGRNSSVAALACPSGVEEQLGRLVGARSGWVLSPPWFESDHAIFALRGIPSLAITSAGVHDLLATVAHTAADTLDIVDPHVLADVAGFVEEWLRLVGSGLLAM